MNFFEVAEGIAIVILLGVVILLFIKYGKLKKDNENEKNESGPDEPDSEELKQQLAKELRSQLAHSIRMPISIISGYGNLIEKGSYDSEEKLKEYLDIICRNVTFLNLAFYTALSDDAYVLPGNFEQLDLLELARNVALYSEKYLKKKNINIEVKSTATQVNVYGSSIDLMRVLYNMVENSARYMEGGDRITVTVEKSRDVALLVFKDNGNAPEIPSHTGGHGLLLIGNVIKIHGGSIETKKNENGFSVYITLPLYTGG